MRRITGLPTAAAAALAVLAAEPVMAQSPSGLTNLDAFVDAYYAFDFDRPADRTRAYTTQPYRHNEFNLNLAFVRARYESERVRGTLALATGTYMQSNYAAETDLLQHLLEGWAGVRIGSRAWLDAGVLPSHIGFESAVSSLNWTLSRSLMADYSPYYEAGVRVTLPVSDQLTAAGVVVNGWQNIRETNDAKSVGVQLQYRPTVRLLLNYSNYVGDEAPAGPEQPDRGVLLRVFHDAYVQLAVSSRLSLATCLDVGTQQRTGVDHATWWTGALLARVSPAREWLVGLRVERYVDRDQVIVSTGVDGGFVTNGASANLDYQPNPQLMWRTELRLFGSDASVWPGRNGARKSDAFVMSSVALTLP